MTERLFEGCPECGGDDGMINIGKSHWLVCDKHRVYWCVGYNLITIPDDETEEVQRRIYRRVEGYRSVQP